MRRLRWIALSMVSASLLTAPARAEEPVPPETPAEPEDPREKEADEAFQLGVALSRKEQWAKALAAFEHAAELTHWADSYFNIAYCRRALGQYVRAREAIHKALGLGDELGPEE